MKDDSYLIIAANARESHRLQNNLWVPSRNILSAATLHRSLRGYAGLDVYYTDDALEALVEDAEFRPTGFVDDDNQPIMRQGRNWVTWSRLRPGLRSVRPLEAWIHLHETPREELEARRMGFITLHAQKTLPPATDGDQLSRLNAVNLARAEVSAAVRDTARDRLVRVAASRVLVKEIPAPSGRLVVSASWTARAAAERVAPSWLVGGLDHESTVKVG